MQRYTINIPEDLEDGTILVLNITLDTKEIEGGRDELIIKPPGEDEIVTYRHTGKLQIIKNYTVSKTNKVNQELNEVPKAPPVPSIEDIINTVMASFLNFENIFKLVEKETWTFLGKVLIDEWINKAGEALPKKKCEITFFRGIDLRSLQIWEKKRMTGFNMTWFFVRKSGKKIEKSTKSKTCDFSKKNLFFIQWINTVQKVLHSHGEEKTWEIVKEIRKEYIEEYHAWVAHKERRLPSLMFWGLDWATIIVSIKRFHSKAYNLEGEMTFHKMFNKSGKLFGESMMETFKNKTNLDSKTESFPLPESQLNDDELLRCSKMFLYLFSKPRSKELSFVEVWREFYANLFMNYPPSIILQNLANIIKPELKSRRNKEYVAETLFMKLASHFEFEYGKLDFLMSTKEDVKNRIKRKQFEPFAENIKNVLADHLQGDLGVDYLRKYIPLDLFMIDLLFRLS